MAKRRRADATPDAKAAATDVMEPELGSDVALTFESPESETITRAEYDPATRGMVVVFRHGRTYAYNPVSSTIWREFYQATSKGKFFSERIRPVLVGRRME
jgi:hypothetical protein